MTRLTNAFSKKAENHAHMMAIYFMHYNFVRIHQTLEDYASNGRGSRAKLWEMSDMVKVLGRMGGIIGTTENTYSYAMDRSMV